MKKEALKEIIRLPQHNWGLLFISLHAGPWFCYGYVSTLFQLSL